MQDEVICGFMNKAIYEEIIPTLTLPEYELMAFAASVTDRFRNPFIDHALLSISLNSTSKWKARVLPTVKDFIRKTGQLPKCLTASLAFLIVFYRNGQEQIDGKLTAVRPNGDSYTISDDPEVLDFYLAHRGDSGRTLAYEVCSNLRFWGEDLTKLPGFADFVANILNEIESKGAYEVLKLL
jgi:tagaturonate reductase